MQDLRYLAHIEPSEARFPWTGCLANYHAEVILAWLPAIARVNFVLWPNHGAPNHADLWSSNQDYM